MMSVTWFCSSFESSSNSNQTTMDHRLQNKKYTSRISVDNVTVDYEEIKVHPEVTLCCSSHQEDCTLSLIDRFPLQNVEQLAVNPKKIDELRRWMQMKEGRCRRCKLLLLTGPTGSGKTTAVKMLCRELKLELIEWNCSESYDVFYDPEGEEIVYEENQASYIFYVVELTANKFVRKFTEFLKSSDRGSIEKSVSQKVILVEQLPNVFYQDPSILHATLRKTIKNTVCMYIFIMSDVNSCWYLSPKRILPANIRCQLGFDELSFNASATVFLSKALRRIALLLNVNASPSQIKKIAENSNGDIRTAIHNLQLCIDGRREFNEICPLHSSTLVDPYHSLGKLLYAKRCDKADSDWKKAEGKLKIELRKIYSRDFPPKDDVSEVLDKSGMNADKLVMFLHEHELNFAPSLSSYLDILNNISLFDSALSRWEVRMDSVLSSYMGEVAARSTIFYNFGCKSRQGKGLYRFYKPHCLEDGFQVFSKEKEIYAAFPPHTYGEVLTLTLPLIRLIKPRTLNNYQYQVLASMNSALCANFTVNQSPTNKRSLIDDEENQFDIEEIDLL
uniref:Cell cycle checkpoint protein RAD17 n=2 Tax=Wuchereria bancrofti TaxID=6293 RepID=A0AAF5PV98_WUCBA